MSSGVRFALFRAGERGVLIQRPMLVVQWRQDPRDVNIAAYARLIRYGLAAGVGSALTYLLAVQRTEGGAPSSREDLNARHSHRLALGLIRVLPNQIAKEQRARVYAEASAKRSAVLADVGGVLAHSLDYRVA